MQTDMLYRQKREKLLSAKCSEALNKKLHFYIISHL